MPEQISFRQLEGALEKLGFEETWVEDRYVQFKNPQADAIIVLSSHQKENALHPAYQRMVEKVLEEKGIMSQDKFEKLLHESSEAIKDENLDKTTISRVPLLAAQ